MRTRENCKRKSKERRGRMKGLIRVTALAPHLERQRIGRSIEVVRASGRLASELRAKVDKRSSNGASSSD